VIPDNKGEMTMRRNHLLMRTAICSFFPPRLPVAVVNTADMAAAITHAQMAWHVDDDAPGGPRPGDSFTNDPAETAG
jgi:hypothetical protein